MTEKISKGELKNNKPFTLEWESDEICQIAKNGNYMGTCEAVDLLNELTEKTAKQEKLINELYQFRLIYNALIFNEWHKHGKIEVYKSDRHHDGNIPFIDDENNWFIVVAILPDGKQVTNHYPIQYWDFFQIPEYDKVKHEFDGHTSEDVLDRLTKLIVKNNKPCKNCIFFIEKLNYCTMWDMEVNADEIIYNCNERDEK